MLHRLVATFARTWSFRWCAHVLANVATIVKPLLVFSFAVFVIGMSAAAGSVQAQGARLGKGQSKILLGLAFSQDSSLVATCGDRVRVFEVESDKLLREIEGRLTRSVVFSPTDRDLFVTAGDDGLVRVWRVSEPDVVHEMLGHVGRASCVAFDASERVLASGSRSYQNGKADIGQLRLWDVGTGKLIRSLDFKEAPVDGVSFSGDGQLLAFCESSRVQVYRVRTWEPVTTSTVLTAIVGIAEKHLTTFRDFPARQLGLSAQMAKTLEGIQSQILKLKPNN